MRLTFSALCLSFCLPTVAVAEVPRVLADIAPVHSIVARIMAGAGAPDLLIPKDADPHHWSMRPSQAAALEAADVVIWMGPEFAPQLEGPVESLATGAIHLVFDPEHSEEDHGDEHHEEEHDDHEDHDDHAHEEAHGVHHWLDPVLVAAFAGEVAVTLSAADPENAALYADNADAFHGEIDALIEDVEAILAPVDGRAFLAGHDAYGPFVARFGLTQAGAIRDSHAAPPSAARMQELTELAVSDGITCSAVEDAAAAELAKVVLPAAEAQIELIDPTGRTLEPGADLYPALIRGMAETFAACLR